MWCSEKKVKEIVHQIIEEELRCSFYTNIISDDYEIDYNSYRDYPTSAKIRLKDTLYAILNYFELKVYKKNAAEIVFVKPHVKPTGSNDPSPTREVVSGGEARHSTPISLAGK